MFQICTFTSDITPPVGHPLCAGWYPPATAIRDSLTAHGVVLTSEAMPPVVLCALDWCELSNLDHLRWRQELAAAVGTDADHVAVQCIHQHDTPWPDRDAQDLLDAYGYHDVIMVGDWSERVRHQAAAAAAAAMHHLQPCTDVAVGQAAVDRIASNRRVMGDDGKVKAVRWTKTRDPAVRAAPEGVIDRMLKSISFWNGERRVACLHYYAVHPTSLDGTGKVDAEFVGVARARRQAADPGCLHIYFTGCAGNVTAGKYNDGIADNRELFAGRIHDAMVAAEAASVRRPLAKTDWTLESVHLPPREDMIEADLRAELADAVGNKNRSKLAIQLTYLQRAETPIAITCLHLNDDIGILHLPGEAFIEYQLAAQACRPDDFIAVASYGDLGTGYITLARSFDEGGYEPVDAFVSGAAEAIMRSAIETVLRR